MKLVISPAKSLEFDKELPVERTTAAVFQNEATYINSILKRQSANDLGKLMHISDALASLNWERNQKFKSATTESRAAVFAFNGDVYSGLDAYSLTLDKIEVLQDKLRILSGLYGLLKPLDAIRPYRLEMGTSLKLEKHKNLYSFWKIKITEQLNNELEEGELLVNLASKEYFSAVDEKLIHSPVLTPQFKDFKNGKYKIISFYAKRARGLMARWLIENNIKDFERLPEFNVDGYYYCPKESSVTEPVFLRD